MLSFDEGVSSFTPEAFPTTINTPIIAVFWGDVDTNEGGTIWYRYVYAFKN